MINPEVPQYMQHLKIDIHDGAIFRTKHDAKEYAEGAIKDQLCTRFIIGEFVYGTDRPVININCVETFGFRNDKKNVNQLELFK